MKKLPKSEFQADHCYIRFTSLTPADPAHYMVVPGNDKWENIRYVLERGMGCLKFSLPMKVVQNSYLCAKYVFSVSGVASGTNITSKTQVYGGDILTVSRHPFPKHLHPYIPPKYWSDLGDMPEEPKITEEPKVLEEQEAAAEQEASAEIEAGSEEEKLERLFCTGQQDTKNVFLPPIVVRILKQHILHPTDYPSLTTPHPLFVCQYCSTQGKHFHTLCPFTETDNKNNTTELVTKVRRIVGIPKSRLRPATEEEISKGSYYLNENNEKVVVLKKEDADLKTSRKRRAPKEEPEEEPWTQLDAEDLLAMRDVESYESQYVFSFEDHLEKQDRAEKRVEDEFYEKHPELKKKKNQICTHYYRGMCHKGKLECEFLHSGDENYIAICQFYVNGQCTEPNCMYRHPPKNVYNNECIAYKNGFCIKGKQCKYKHVKFMSPSKNPELHAATRKLMEAALCF
jgi:hypothetical protein